MGKSLQEIEKLTESELAEWEMFYKEQPFGLWREDYRTAQISHLLAMINRDPKGKAPELLNFMPFYSKEQNEVEEDDGVESYLANR